ncbi:MAG: fasciclin domain-containing protein, partial [Gemmatimonadetes bacterium]|nr:fasciclin domain-containing protein [Gemmatimonadota bacterium]NIQ54699.1 fasciclin domain-containing protein [Gemmatimonadota bacterium]NIU74904.1 fasciclin domain-containing protein [Gammaproteobacteria bacterium]NIX44789.1 fasciclin domain-containing protein [Gemmatimonadota bacterium]NIY09025.1 fasciclin domain-containing protein [Gemmatimonadota bacterium]
MRKIAMVALVGAALVPAQASAQYGEAGKTIVDVAVEAGSFETLVTAVKAAGLVETLSGEGPFTVFAPTDAAFAKLPEGTLEALLADREALKAVLTYHVIPGKVMAKDVLAAEQVSPATVQGEALDVRVADGSVKVDGATVVQPDVEASNGVIHVIDTVVLPGS